MVFEHIIETIIKSINELVKPEKVFWSETVEMLNGPVTWIYYGFDKDNKVQIGMLWITEETITLIETESATTIQFEWHSFDPETIQKFLIESYERRSRTNNWA